MPLRILIQMSAPMKPADAARLVTRTMRPTSASMASSEPPLKPNQPSHRIRTPSAASGKLCAGMGFTEPSA